MRQRAGNQMAHRRGCNGGDDPRCSMTPLVVASLALIVGSFLKSGMHIPPFTGGGQGNNHPPPGSVPSHDPLPSLRRWWSVSAGFFVCGMAQPLFSFAYACWWAPPGTSSSSLLGPRSVPRLLPSPNSDRYGAAVAYLASALVVAGVDGEDENAVDDLRLWRCILNYFGMFTLLSVIAAVVGFSLGFDRTEGTTTTNEQSETVDRAKGNDNGGIWRTLPKAAKTMVRKKTKSGSIRGPPSLYPSNEVFVRRSNGVVAVAAPNDDSDVMYVTHQTPSTVATNEDFERIGNDLLLPTGAGQQGGGGGGHRVTSSSASSITSVQAGRAIDAPKSSSMVATMTDRVGECQLPSNANMEEAVEIRPPKEDRLSHGGNESLDDPHSFLRHSYVDELNGAPPHDSLLADRSGLSNDNNGDGVAQNCVQYYGATGPPYNVESSNNDASECEPPTAGDAVVGGGQHGDEHVTQPLHLQVTYQRQQEQCGASKLCCNEISQQHRRDHVDARVATTPGSNLTTQANSSRSGFMHRSCDDLGFNGETTYLEHGHIPPRVQHRFSPTRSYNSNFSPRDGLDPLHPMYQMDSPSRTDEFRFPFSQVLRHVPTIAYAVSTVTINAFSTYMDYILRNSHGNYMAMMTSIISTSNGRKHVALTGTMFQLLTVLSSFVVQRIVERSGDAANNTAAITRRSPCHHSISLLVVGALSASIILVLFMCSHALMSNFGHNSDEGGNNPPLMGCMVLVVAVLAGPSRSLLSKSAALALTDGILNRQTHFDLRCYDVLRKPSEGCAQAAATEEQFVSLVMQRLSGNFGTVIFVAMVGLMGRMVNGDTRGEVGRSMMNQCVLAYSFYLLIGLHAICGMLVFIKSGLNHRMPTLSSCFGGEKIERGEKSSNFKGGVAWDGGNSLSTPTSTVVNARGEARPLIFPMECIP